MLVVGCGIKALIEIIVIHNNTSLQLCRSRFNGIDEFFDIFDLLRRRILLGIRAQREI